MDGFARVENALTAQNRWDSSFTKRLHVLEGDTCLVNFGLKDDDYTFLTTEVYRAGEDATTLLWWSLVSPFLSSAG
jgi:thioester reductase-like protein